MPIDDLDLLSIQDITAPKSAHGPSVTTLETAPPKAAGCHRVAGAAPLGPVPRSTTCNELVETLRLRYRSAEFGHRSQLSMT